MMNTASDRFLTEEQNGENQVQSLDTRTEVPSDASVKDRAKITHYPNKLTHPQQHRLEKQPWWSIYKSLFMC